MPVRLPRKSKCLWSACLLLAAVGCGDSNSSNPDAGADGGGSGESGTTGASGGKGGHDGHSGNAGRGGVGAGGQHSGTGGRAGGGAGSSSGVATGEIKLVPNVVAGKKTQSSGSSGGVGSQQSALRVGTPSATTLLSLKYYIISIQLCEDLELMGSGYSSTNGCIDLYRNQTFESPDYTTYTVTQAQADNEPGRYIDLMSSDGQAALRKPVTLQLPIATADPNAAGDDVDLDDAGVPEAPKRQPGVYRYGLINFYRPIKVKAEFPIVGEPAENFFRTKSVTATLDNTPPGGMPSQRVEIGNTLEGATEETTYMLNNGGVVFVFQKPFAITQADVDAKAEILIDLVFNPDSFGQAYTTDCENDIRWVICDRTNNVALEMPYVRMSPVPRKQGEKTRKETYLVDYDNSSKLRIELYYNDADSEASVQGVDTATVYDTTVPAGDVPSFNTVASNFVAQQGSVTSNDASISLLDYRRQTNLEGLVRRHDGSLTIHCLYPGWCGSLNDTITRAYTYVGDSVVSN